MFVFYTNTFSEPQGTLELLVTAEVVRTMIMEAVEVRMEAGMEAAEAGGVWGHPGETGNAVAATDHDQGAEIDPVEVGDVPDPGNFCYFFDRDF